MISLIFSVTTVFITLASTLILTMAVPYCDMRIPDRRLRILTIAIPAIVSVIAIGGMFVGILAQEISVLGAAVLVTLSLVLAALPIRFARPPEAITPLQDLYRSMASLKSPAIAFHFSDGDLPTPTHVEMWVDAIHASGVEWYVICREPHHHEYFLRTGRVKSVLAEKAALLPAAIAPSVRAVLYANNAQKNREMLKARDDLTHVQMLHGDSDKPPSYSPLTRNFDKVFVSGQMGQDRYAVNGVFIPQEKFVHVGRPQAAGMGRGKRGETREIVYMPTWIGRFEDTQFSSVRKADKVIREISTRFPGMRVTFKPHPLTFRDPEWAALEPRIRAALRSGKGRFAPEDMSALEAYKLADILVTDISSTMIDFLHTERPQVVLLPDGQDLPENRFPSLGAAYQVRPDLSDLGEKFSDAIGQDSLEQGRHMMRRYAFGDFNGPAEAAFVKAILSVSIS